MKKFKIISTSTRFELAIPEGNGLAVHRLNHSAMMSIYLI